MPVINPYKDLTKRYFYTSSSWNGGARWAFFAIFIVIIIVCVLGTLRLNKRRSRRGVQPIYGTRWMTPPSYYQSQGQYNQPTRGGDSEMPNAYVPTYTERANDNDMGHYDTEGNFHANPSAKGPMMPEAAHQRQTSNSNGVPASAFNDSNQNYVNDENDDQNFTRPSGPPPSTERSSSYVRPNHPPPS